MKEIQELNKKIKEQGEQITSLRKAIDILLNRLKDTDTRARRNSEAVRRNVNDINTIKGKLRR